MKPKTFYHDKKYKVFHISEFGGGSETWFPYGNPKTIRMNIRSLLLDLGFNEVEE